MNKLPAPAAAVPAGRVDALDALRGLAMVWMAGFHFAFDLNQFGLIEPRQSFTGDALWTTQRTCIVSLFLFCAGFSLAAALHAGQGWARFWRRWSQVAGCALLVSLGSAWMFPRSWIFFGVLHGMAVMLLLARWLAPPAGVDWRAGRLAAVAALAAAALLLPRLWVHPAFDAGALQWIGLGTFKPRTEDYVPVLPWLGVLLAGLLAGQALLRRPGGALRRPLPRGLQPLAALGRWPLSFYMLHQPVLIGLTLLIKAGIGR